MWSMNQIKRSAFAGGTECSLGVLLQFVVVRKTLGQIKRVMCFEYIQLGLHRQTVQHCSGSGISQFCLERGVPVL